MCNLKIGDVILNNPFFLAPLAGITDSSFRKICKEQGAGLVYSEMVSGKGLYFKDKNTERLLEILEEEKPVAFQIFGSEPDVIGFTAKTLSNRGNVLLDINMGCPVPKVVRNGEGSALLKNPDLIYDLIKAAVENSSKPVTAKIRIGWDENNINAIEVAKAIAAGGASAVAVHGRTREQYYSGKANWDIIKQVKENVNIPVIGNGDITCGRDAIKLMEVTGCDFVMIARGSLGNPWIFGEALALWSGEKKPEEPTLEEKISIIFKHLEYVIELKGEYVAVREMRKHVAWYLKGIRGSADIRRAINTVKDTTAMKELLQEVKNR